MSRIIVLALCALLATGCMAAAQDQATYAYEAYFRVSFADLEEWNRLYREEWTPILTDLQEEGVLMFFDQYEHSTGGDHNILLVLGTADWASLGTFWEEFLTRVDEGGTRPDLERLIQSHRDEIWELAEGNLADDAEYSYVYAATFQVRFTDREAWDRMWTELAAPILADGMNDGILVGWTPLIHNTGGPQNSKILFFFDNWDDIDDLMGSLLGRMAEEHPEEWESMNRMFTRHDDVIWMLAPGAAEE